MHIDAPRGHVGELSLRVVDCDVVACLVEEIEVGIGEEAGEGEDCIVL